MQKKNEFVVFTIGILVFLLILNVFLLWPRSYTVTYTVEEFQIVEEYNKKEDYYHFQTVFNDVVFDNTFISKKVDGKRLINKVSTFSNGEVICLDFLSDKIKMMPVCYKEGEYIDFALAGSEATNEFTRAEVKKTTKEYKNIKIDTLMGKKVLIWGQKGYYYITEDETKELMFLENESYYNNIPYQVDEYVMTPDYDSDYTFNKFNIINMKTGKTTEWKLDFDLNFNSYYLGTKKQVAYLFDRKEKKEYAINPKKKKIDIVSKAGEAEVWSGKWETISVGKLANNDFIFETDDVFMYEIENGGLYRKKKNQEKIKITNKHVDAIIKTDGNDVYYLVDDILYLFSPLYGEIAMLQYSEWNFNSKNTIFIY